MKTEELTGVWALADESKSNLPTELSQLPIQINFLENGSFTGLNLPSSLFYSTKTWPTYINANGKWRIQMRNQLQEVELTLTSTNLPGEENIASLSALFIDNNASPKSLYYFIDDPDLQKKISFVK